LDWMTDQTGHANGQFRLARNPSTETPLPRDREYRSSFHQFSGWSDGADVPRPHNHTGR
jgi:hypothetical protein